MSSIGLISRRFLSLKTQSIPLQSCCSVSCFSAAVAVLTSLPCPCSLNRKYSTTTYRSEASRLNAVENIKQVKRDVDNKVERRKTSLLSLKNLLYSAKTQVGKKELMQDESTLDSLIAKTMEEMSHYSSNQLVSLLKCLQKVQMHSPQLVESIAVNLTNKPSKLTLETASGVMKTFRDQGLSKWADKMSSFVMDRLLTALGNEEDIHPRTVTAILEVGEWPSNTTTLLEKYVLANAEQFTLHSLARTLTFMMRKQCITHPVLQKCAKIVQNQLQTDIQRVELSDVGTLFWLFGKLTHYDEGLFLSLEHLLQESKHVNSWFVTTAAWSCAKVRHYDPIVMDKFATYSLQHLEKFSFHDMSNLVYAFGSLNHPHEELFSAVAAKMTKAPYSRGNEQAFWILLWASMVFGIYENSVLSRVLDPEFLKASFHNTHLKVMQPLQLSVALNRERPDLGFSDSQTPNSKWLECFSSVSGIHTKHMQTATVLRLESHLSSGRPSTFVENVLRALTLVVGGAQYINHEVISLSGYSMDFEVILNEENRPITIPNEWKRRSKDIVLKSIGVMDPYVENVFQKNNQGSTLIDSMRTTESCDSHMTTEKGYSLPLSSKGPGKLINLASDWGSKFASPQVKVSRKIAVEADGYPHFARNCDHVMGPTVLKHRQLNALGWEVVQIPYLEWRLLKSGDDHAHYLSNKIFA